MFRAFLSLPAVNAAAKLAECYLGLLYVMEDVAVYGYITPLKMKIVIALALSDSVIRDAEVQQASQVLLPKLKRRLKQS